VPPVRLELTTRVCLAPPAMAYHPLGGTAAAGGRETARHPKAAGRFVGERRLQVGKVPLELLRQFLEQRHQPWRSNAPGVVVSSIEASVSPSVAIGSAVAKSFRFVGATRIADKRQCRSSRRRSGGPAPGPTYLARQARVPAESDFTTSSLGMFVDGATTPGAQGDGTSIR